MRRKGIITAIALCERRSTMKKTMFTLIAGLLISCAWTLTAQAQLARTFVSTTGNDANTCDRDAPCRNFIEAISKTVAGGEVTALDSGSYGRITVTKSLTIQGAPGAAVMVSRNAAINPVVFVNLNDQYMKVVLRNLQISKPFGDGPNKGIEFWGAGSLHVENCIISGFDYASTDTGISATFSVGLQDKNKLFLKNTIIRDNTVGIQLGGTVDASIDNCRIENNVIGVEAKNKRTTISHSFVAGTLTGIEIHARARVYVETCVVTNNNMGIVTLNTESTGQGIVYVSNTGIFGNDTGIGGSGYSLSFGNNRLANNNFNGVFSETLSQQ
jgi:hypothetical protein